MTFVPEGGGIDFEGQRQILYGAIVNHYRPIGESRSAAGRAISSGATGRQRVSISEAIGDLINSILKSNPYLRVVKGSSRKASQRIARNTTTRHRNWTPNDISIHAAPAFFRIVESDLQDISHESSAFNRARTSVVLRPATMVGVLRNAWRATPFGQPGKASEEHEKSATNATAANPTAPAAP